MVETFVSFIIGSAQGDSSFQASGTKVMHKLHLNFDHNTMKPV